MAERFDKDPKKAQIKNIGTERSTIMIGLYLNFNRNCAEALEFYAKAFNAEISGVQKYGNMPPNPAFPVAESDKNLILHSTLKIDGMEIMASDSSRGCTSGSNMYITITSKDVEYVKHAWDVLKQGGHIHMELAPTFFAQLHGSLQDKFGINWMFSVMR